MYTYNLKGRRRNCHNRKKGLINGHVETVFN